MKRTLHLVAVAAAAGLLVFACGDDDSSSGTVDGGSGGSSADDASTTGGKTGSGGKAVTEAGAPDSSIEADASDAGATVAFSVCGGKTGADLTTCGEYLVLHLAACGDCHTPRNPDGSPVLDKFLAGNPSFADLDPTDTEVGNIPAPNLTTLSARGWTADDIKAAFLDGERAEARGGGIFPAMPYYVMHNMAAIDADAIAQYLLSLTPITNAIPARQPLPAPLDQLPLPFPAFDEALVPQSTLPASDPDRAKADYGRYLASAGPCMECHTKRTPFGTLDPNKLFAGGEEFDLGPVLGVATSKNITPASNGIKDYTTADLIRVLREGVNKAGKPICPPMPVGPNGAFGGLKDAEVEAIAAYILSLPPIVNPEDGGTIGPSCTLPPLGDAGSN